MSILDPRDLPDDKDTLLDMLGAKLNLISDNSHKGQALHILAKLLTDGSGGGGLPTSVAGDITHYSDRPDGDTSNLRTMYDYGTPYVFFEGSDKPVLGAPATVLRGQSFVTPMAAYVNHGGKGYEYGGAYSLTNDAQGALTLRLNASGVSGNIEREWSAIVGADVKQFCVVNGLNPEYNATHNAPMVVTVKRLSNSQMTVTLYEAKGNALVKVGDTVTDISNSTSNVSNITISACRVGSGTDIAVNIVNTFADKRALLVISADMTTSADIVANGNAKGRSEYNTAQTVYSYNGNGEGFIVTSHQSNVSRTVSYELYANNGGTIGLVGSFTTTTTDLREELGLSISCVYEDDQASNYLYKFVSCHEHNTGDIPFWTWDGMSNTIVEGTVDLSAHFHEYHVEQVGYMVEQDGYLPFKQGFYMLRSRDGTHYGLIDDVNLKLCGVLPTFSKALRGVSGYSIDDYFVMYEATYGGAVNVAVYETWAWATYKGLVPWTTEPDNKTPVVPNYLGAPTVATLNPVTKWENSYCEGMYLPVTGGVVALCDTNNVYISDEAAVGTMWTLICPKGLDTNPNKNVPNYKGGLFVDEGTDYKALCSLSSGGDGCGRIAWAFHIVKQETKYTIEQLI